MLRQMRTWRTGARSHDRKLARAALQRVPTAAERARGQTLAEVQLLGCQRSSTFHRADHGNSPPGV
jgi:hypothetical protein